MLIIHRKSIMLMHRPQNTSNQALVLLHYYRNSPPISKSWIRACTSSTQLQNRSFHVVERTRTSSKCQKMKYSRAKRAKIRFFIVKYANLWGFSLPSSSWLLKFLSVTPSLEKATFFVDDSCVYIPMDA